MSDSARPPMATPRVAAGALIRDPTGRILLVRPTYKDGWDIPGGYVEPNESPADACTRELIEEIGLQREIGPLLVVDWAPHPDEGDKLLFIFDGGILPDIAELIPDGTEIAEVAFHRPDALSQLMPDRLTRRLIAAFQAAAQGRTAYAENGTIRTAAAPDDVRQSA